MTSISDAATPPPFTIVTSFFDIGRSNWRGFERTRAYYLECFKFWTRMRNRLVIYCSPETGEMARKIREDYGLGDKTIVVPVDDVFAIDRPLYERIAAGMARAEYKAFREWPEKPEASVPAYNYLMYLKAYFVVDAIKRGLTGEAVAWVDFGFNQNGVYYLKPEEFDFEWRHELNDRFHLFARLKMDDRPMFEIIRTMGDSFQGTVMPGPARLWPVVLDLFGRNLNHLIACGLPDMDQTLLVMAYRENPEIFQVHVMEHYQLQSVRMFGGGHLTVKKQKKHKRIKREAKERWRNGERFKALRGYADYLLTKMRNELE